MMNYIYICTILNPLIETGVKTGGSIKETKVTGQIIFS